MVNVFEIQSTRDTKQPFTNATNKQNAKAQPAKMAPSIIRIPKRAPYI